MARLHTQVSASTERFQGNAAAMQRLVQELRDRTAKAALGGPESARTRHAGRGKLLPRERVERLIAAGRVRLLLDMAAVDYVDSAGVGVLVAKYLSVRRRGGDLRFVHLSPRVMHVMEIAHLLTIFQSFDNEQAALGSFAG